MKILDWYILKKFMVTFVFTILMITVITVVIDTSEKANDFVKSGLPTSVIIKEYYFGFVPQIVSMIFPLIVFIAVIFFTSKMAGRSEIIAILASGVKYSRFLRPYMVGGLLLAGILWYANQYVIPPAQGKRAAFQETYIDKNSSYLQGFGNNQNYYMRVDSVTFIGLRSYDTMYKSGSNFFLQQLSSNKVVYNLRAERISWDTAQKNWKLENIVERYIDSLNETVTYNAQGKNISLNFKPQDLRKDPYLKDKLITPDLVEFIRMEELRGSEGLNTLKVERYRRDATPVSVLLLTIIGAVVASKKVRGGSGMHMAYGIMSAACFILMDRFSQVFSIKGNFPPLLAAWLPNMIFAVIAYILYRRAPK